MALKPYSLRGIITSVAWEIEYSDEFGLWWASLSANEQDSINLGVRLLQERGPNLKRTFADTICRFRLPEHEGAAMSA
jgi:hypothetical protein